MGLVLPLFLWLGCKKGQLLSSLPYVFSLIAHSAELGGLVKKREREKLDRGVKSRTVLLYKHCCKILLDLTEHGSHLVGSV